jgi:hypothetical protein
MCAHGPSRDLFAISSHQEIINGEARFTMFAFTQISPFIRDHCFFSVSLFLDMTSWGSVNKTGAGLLNGFGKKRNSSSYNTFSGDVAWKDALDNIGSGLLHGLSVKDKSGDSSPRKSVRLLSEANLVDLAPRSFREWKMENCRGIASTNFRSSYFKCRVLDGPRNSVLRYRANPKRGKENEYIPTDSSPDNRGDGNSRHHATTAASKTNRYGYGRGKTECKASPSRQSR